MKNPLVSVIVVTLDNSVLLEKCLKSLKSQSYKNLEVICVDNGSKENIKSVLDAVYPGCIYIRLEENLGFAGGNNEGFKKASGEYLALINNDAVASPGWIESMAAVLDNDPEVGQAASIIVDGNDPQALDSIGLGIAFDGMSRQVHKGEPVPELKEPKPVLVASGCACMYRAAALKEVGFFDDDFFAYCEDTDLGLRLRFAGWKAAAAPGAVVTHFYSRTLGKYSRDKLFLVERNHFWVVVKNFPLILFPLVPFVTLWRYLLSAMLLTRRTPNVTKLREGGVFSLFWAVVRAYFSMLLKLPAMLRKRAKNAGIKKLGPWGEIALLREFMLPMEKILERH